MLIILGNEMLGKRFICSYADSYFVANLNCSNYQVSKMNDSLVDRLSTPEAAILLVSIREGD